MSIAAWDIAIDVSDAQGIIDWPAVRAAGILIAFVKASEGQTFVARTFERNRGGAAAQGIVVVPYHFLRPDPPDAQVKHFRAVTGIEDGMPVALDWEGRAATTCTAAEAEAIGAALQAIANRPPIGYWGIPGASPASPTAMMRTWPRWIPRYPQAGVAAWSDFPETLREVPVTWWHNSRGDLPQFAQYSAWGRVPGIAGNVDRSVAFFPTPADAVAWLTGNVPAPAPGV